ncbi:MAG: metal-sensitive transcriptional regulator [Propionibacteriaceae bacterium]|jgi:DNA-binding FrmR family transcriptional regulator|nr:metal-sensitive transcriptional regulator [Propionibacteriaceae bacterium]
MTAQALDEAAQALDVAAQALDDAAQALDEVAHHKRRVLNRLRRARGQLTALITAIESNAPRRDIVIQLSAVSKAIDRAGFAIVSQGVKHCMGRAVGSPHGQNEPPEHYLTLEELEKLFLILA